MSFIEDVSNTNSKDPWADVMNWDSEESDIELNEEPGAVALYTEESTDNLTLSNLSTKIFVPGPGSTESSRHFELIDLDEEIDLGEEPEADALYTEEPTEDPEPVYAFEDTPEIVMDKPTPSPLSRLASMIRSLAHVILAPYIIGMVTVMKLLNVVPEEKANGLLNKWRNNLLQAFT